MPRKTLAGLAIVPLIAGLGTKLTDPTAAAQGAQQGIAVPRFKAAAVWPRLPNNWVLGEVSSVAVDRHDHVRVLHRPRTVPADQQENAAPRARVRCREKFRQVARRAFRRL